MKNFKMFDIIGDITPNMDLAFSKFLNEVINEDTATPIIITINSFGGHVQSGISIYNKIRAIKNPVYTLITGVCESIADIVLLSVPYERRFSFPNTLFLAHSVCVENIASANVMELKEHISSTEIENKLIHRIFKGETSIPIKALDDLFINYNLENMKVSSDFYSDYSIAHVVTTFEEIVKN